MKMFFYLMLISILYVSDAVACLDTYKMANPPSLQTTLLVMLCCFLLGFLWALSFKYQARFCHKFIKSRKSVYLAVAGSLVVFIGGLIIARYMALFISNTVLYSGVDINYRVFAFMVGLSGMFIYGLGYLIPYVTAKAYKKSTLLSLGLIGCCIIVICTLYTDKLYSLSYYDACPMCDCM